MRGSKTDLPVTLDLDQVVVREIEWGDIHVGIESYRQKLDATPFFQGLPDNRCQCPHWGYILSGRMVVKYADREEVVNAGDAYYMAPGHIPVLDPGTELVEFSPKEAFRQTMEAVERNLAATAPA